MKIDDTDLKLLARIMLPGVRPSIRELCGVVGVTFNAITQRLAKLRKAGLVSWEPGKNRTLVSLVRWIPVDELERSE